MTHTNQKDLDNGLDDDGNVIQSLLLLDQLKKTKNVRCVVVSSLKRLAEKMDEIEDRAVLLAAVDLLDNIKSGEQ